MTSEIQRVIEAVWRIESAQLIATLTRLVHDVGIAEDLAQDAFVAALEQWPESGVPDKPAAWLMTTAKHRAIDRLRRVKLLDRKHHDLARELESANDDSTAFDNALDDDVGDDLLRLIFMTCHPVLTVDARVALTLRLLGGLTTDEIARAFLAAEPTIAQRIVRAKRSLADVRAEFEVPRGDELAARLDAVLQVLYLIFNEGYSATAGDDLVRPQLCDDAVRLARIVAQLMPSEPEVHGLVGLMEIQASRLRARTDHTGAPILLLDQDRSRWDQLLIRRGIAALTRARELGGETGPYALQAAIAECHATARRADDTNWQRIAELYATLGRVSPSPIIELNRAVAVSMAFGPAAGLEIADALVSEPSLRTYHHLPAVRADLLSKLGRRDEAAAEFERAATLTRNARERDALATRARTLRANA